MDEELETILNSLPVAPKMFGDLMTAVHNLPSNAKVLLNSRDKQVEIFLAEGGMLACPLSALEGDIAPFCD